MFLSILENRYLTLTLKIFYFIPIERNIKLFFFVEWNLIVFCVFYTG